MKSHFYFKLFNNVKSEYEVEFAKLELNSLFGRVEVIRNFFDKLFESPLNTFTKEPVRIQDIIMHELPYGKVQGYYGTKERLIDVTKLVKRLAYTREIFLVVKNKISPRILIKKIFPKGIIGKNVQFFVKDNFVLFRFITNQYFLEKSEYISKLSRNEKEIDQNVKVLFSHLIKNIHRIPASSTLSVGKRLEDYFAIREEPSLYLNHYMHPYKGKFHPKMVRALLNYICPGDKEVVLDNFAGSGTLLVEAGYLGLNSLGIEINPLSALMSNVKCHSVSISLRRLKRAVNKYLTMVKKEITYFVQSCEGQTSLVKHYLEPERIRKETQTILNELKRTNSFRNREEVIQKIIIAKELLKYFRDKKIREFLLLSLSGAISDVAKRTKNEFEDVLENRLKDLYNRIYLFHKLNKVLKITVGHSKTYVGDARNMKEIKTESVDGIVNSPPYSTALDYIKNDYPQLVILELVDNLKKLERDMIGNPRANYDKKVLLKLISDPKEDPLSMSPTAHKYVEMLLTRGRKDVGLKVYKFFIDMLLALQEMYRVLKKNKKCVMIIGNNHFKVRRGYVEIPNDEIILDLAKHVGFKTVLVMKRDLQKTSVGNIRTESILIFEK